MVPSLRSGSLGLGGFDVDLNLYLLTDQHATRFEDSVPFDAPVLAVDLGSGRETSLGVAPWIGCDTIELERKRNWLGDTLDREVPSERIVAANGCLLYTSPSPRDRQKSRMPSSA